MGLLHPGDADVWPVRDQLYLGDALLVAPVLTAGASSRPVYLPRGMWIDYNDRKTRHTGPATITASAPLDVIPRYVRAGSILPRGDILQSNNNWTPGWTPALRVEFYPAAGVSSRFDYYNGSTVVPITGSMSATAVNWQTGSLGIKAALEVHGIDRYSSVTRNNRRLAAGDFQYDAATQVMTIPLSASGPTSVRILR
jgi:alpha-glucosidase